MKYGKEVNKLIDAFDFESVLRANNWKTTIENYKKIRKITVKLIEENIEKGISNEDKFSESIGGFSIKTIFSKDFISLSHTIELKVPIKVIEHIEKPIEVVDVIEKDLLKLINFLDEFAILTLPAVAEISNFSYNFDKIYSTLELDKRIPTIPIKFKKFLLENRKKINEISKVVIINNEHNDECGFSIKPKSEENKLYFLCPDVLSNIIDLVENSMKNKIEFDDNQILYKKLIEINSKIKITEEEFNKCYQILFINNEFPMLLEKRFYKKYDLIQNENSIIIKRR